MKAHRKSIVCFISLAVAGLIFTSTSQAVTKPASIFKFTAKQTADVFSVKSKGWRDPAFGDMGWTHSSDWGTFRARKGSTITIQMVAADVGIHPGSTVWFRGFDDTAPDDYVVDHFYPQHANFVKFGATDETTGASLGNVVMRYVAHGYDVDGNSKNVTRMNPVNDGVPGRLTLTFTTRHTGNHMFVVGGFNPDAGVDTSLKYNIDTMVTVTPPPAP